METKVIIFDFDGTLTVSKSSTWERIWKKVNAEDLDKELYNKYHNNEIDYDTWLKIGVQEIAKRGYKLQDLQELVSSIKFINDIETVLKFLTENNIKIYILSGGIKTVIKSALKDLNKYITHIEAPDFLFDNNGNLLKHVSLSHNPENKHEFVSQIVTKEEVLPQEVLFIGNGKNDETVYLSKVNTLCFNADNADYTNKKIWHNFVETKTLKDILPFISCKK